MVTAGFRFLFLALALHFFGGKALLAGVVKQAAYASAATQELCRSLNQSTVQYSSKGSDSTDTNKYKLGTKRASKCCSIRAFSGLPPENNTAYPLSLPDAWADSSSCMCFNDFSRAGRNFLSYHSSFLEARCHERIIIVARK